MKQCRFRNKNTNSKFNIKEMSNLHSNYLGKVFEIFPLIKFDFQMNLMDDPPNICQKKSQINVFFVAFFRSTEIFSIHLIYFFQIDFYFEIFFLTYVLGTLKTSSYLQLLWRSLVMSGFSSLLLLYSIS